MLLLVPMGLSFERINIMNFLQLIKIYHLVSSIHLFSLIISFISNSFSSQFSWFSFLVMIHHDFHMPSWTLSAPNKERGCKSFFNYSRIGGGLDLFHK